MARNTRSECLRELPGEAWEVDAGGRLCARWQRGTTAMVLRPTLERRRRREVPAVWACEAVEPERNDALKRLAERYLQGTHREGLGEVPASDETERADPGRVTAPGLSTPANEEALP